MLDKVLILWYNYNSGQRDCLLNLRRKSRFLAPSSNGRKPDFHSGNTGSIPVGVTNFHVDKEKVIFSD